MTKQTQTFAQWFTLLLEWLDPDEIAMSFDCLTRMYHQGTSVQDAALTLAMGDDLV